MSDIVLFLVVILAVGLLYFIAYRLCVAIILYRYIVDTSKLGKKDGDTDAS